mmetsp:Transcript_46233/g.148456  ORF Transcript_46233/g.148456 Transcript_46233/m.148456 type:complete len:131 (+) Transcript_46233:1508-1900(+)
MGTPPMKILFGTNPPKFLAAWAAMFITPEATEPEPRLAGGNPIGADDDAAGEAAAAGASLRGLPQTPPPSLEALAAAGDAAFSAAFAGCFPEGIAADRLPEADGPMGTEPTIDRGPKKAKRRLGATKGVA